MTTNIILTVIAIAMIAVAGYCGIFAAKTVVSWDDDTTRGQKLFGVVLAVVSVIVIGLAIRMMVTNVPKIYQHVQSQITAQTQADPEQETTEPTGTVEDSEATEPTESTEATEETTDAEGSTEVTAPEPNDGATFLGMSENAKNVLLFVVGVLMLVLLIFLSVKLVKNFARIGRGVLRWLAVIALLAAFILSFWLIFTNAPSAFAMITGNKTKTTEDDITATSPSEEETEEVEATEEEVTLTLPDGAFAVDFTEDDLLKAMRTLTGDENFAWETYQNSFSEDLFPSNYQNRQSRSKSAMQKWYGDDSKEGFSDPVWYPMDELIGIYHSDEWKNMGKEQQLQFLESIRLQVYDQILRNPRYCEMFVEFFYKLAEVYPEIVERNASWLPEFQQWYAQANDISNKAKNADGEEIVAGISVFFEPISNSGDARILQKKYVMNAARICCMYSEFQFAKKPVQKPTSEVNWHLAFGKDAQTAKVGMLTDPKDQESEPAIILLYRYKGSTAMKTGLNIFDSRLEIFPLTEKVKEEKPAKTSTPNKSATPNNNPNPGKNPDPGKNPNPGKTNDPDKKPDPGTTPNPGPNPNPDPKKYTFTVYYKYKDGGGDMYSPDISTHSAGDVFGISAKTPKDGYRLEGDASKTITMPAHDDSYTFWYIKNKSEAENERPTGKPDSNTPSGNADGGNGDNQPTKPNDSDHTPAPSQPEKKPDGLPSQKPDAPEGNGSSDNSGPNHKVPDQIHTDTNLTDEDSNGSNTSNSSGEGANSQAPTPND